MPEIPSVDPAHQLPPAVRERLALNFEDPASPEGAALGRTFVAGSVSDAGGITTPGAVVKIGPEGAIPDDVGTAGIVGGGADDYENVIGGIIANVNTPASNIPPDGPGTGGGALTAPDGNWNWVWGGYDNVVNGWACQVHGYHCKVDVGANHITIAGGSIHTIDAGVAYGTIGGGTRNQCSASYATISGGAESVASGLYSTIGGGYSHSVTQRSATVAGGEQNDATATYATIGGGLSNGASGSAATVAGGQSNVASGPHSFVTGRDNTASQEATVATGRGASASVPGERAHSSSVFATQGDAQHRQFVMRRQTTDATPTALFANAAGTSPMLMPADTTWAFRALVSARRTDADNESAGYKIEGAVDRNATASTIAFVGTPTVTVLGEDNAGWDCAISVNTSNGALVITVTGETSKTVRWVAVVDVAQVTG